MRINNLLFKGEKYTKGLSSCYIPKVWLKNCRQNWPWLHFNFHSFMGEVTLWKIPFEIVWPGFIHTLQYLWFFCFQCIDTTFARMEIGIFIWIPNWSCKSNIKIGIELFFSFCMRNSSWDLKYNFNGFGILEYDLHTKS